MHADEKTYSRRKNMTHKTRNQPQLRRVRSEEFPAMKIYNRKRKQKEHILHEHVDFTCIPGLV